MKPLLPHLLLSLALTSVCMISKADSDKQLIVHVEFDVKDLPESDARMLILPETGIPYIVEDLSSLIKIKMELNTKYLVEFQRYGCVSRQLFFDTHIPDDSREPAMIFSTELTLEVPEEGQDFEFLGPVGYIYFEESGKAFLYHRDYREFGDQVMLRRMAEEKKKNPIPVIPVVFEKPGYTTHPGYEYGILVRTRKTSAPKVHLTGKRTHSERQRMSTMEYKRPTRTVSQAPRSVPEMEKEVETFEIDSYETTTASRLRITKDIYIHEGASKTRFRKVVHRYGQIYYFVDGISCTERAYLVGTALHRAKELALNGQ